MIRRITSTITITITITSATITTGITADAFIAPVGGD
jgi:hypothetical protein